MERILDIELTPKEKERAEKLREEHNTQGFLYMENVILPTGEPGAEIIWSPQRIEACAPTDSVKICKITDIPE